MDRIVPRSRCRVNREDFRELDYSQLMLDAQTGLQSRSQIYPGRRLQIDRAAFAAEGWRCEVRECFGKDLFRSTGMAWIDVDAPDVGICYLHLARVKVTQIPRSGLPRSGRATFPYVHDMEKMGVRVATPCYRFRQSRLARNIIARTHSNPIHSDSTSKMV